MDHEFREPPEKKPRLTTQGINETDFSQDVLENDNEFTVKENLKEFVSPEELDKLREFKVLDETKSNDEDSNDEDSDSSDGQPIPDEEIEKMLEENLPDNLKGAPKPKDRPYVTVSKTVLEEKGVNHFEVLPLDWMVIQHYSGMPLYMHRTTRVCTLSKPYFLGKGNARRHEIPLSAIPCLAYRRALEEEEKQKEIDKRIQEQIRKQKQANEDKTNEKSTNEAVNIVKNGLSKSYVDESLGNKKNNNLLLNRSKCPYNKQSDNIVCDAKFRINSDNVIDRDKVDDSITKLNDYKVLQDNLKNDIEMAMLDIQKTSEIINKDVKCNENNKEFNGVNENHDNTSHQAVIVGKDQIKQEREDVQENEDENETNVEEAPDEIVDTNNENVDANNENVDANNENVDTNNEKEGNEDNLDDAAFSQRLVTLPGGIVMAPPRVETVGNNLKKQYLTPEHLNDYCKKLFKFKVIKLMHFKRWAERRKYYKARNRKTLQFPTLSEGTKLITIPMQHNSQENGGKPTKRDWVLSMNGLSYLSVFHEYVGRALKTQPVYEFKNLENAATPYQATVYISGMQYGVGFGSSKRQAKAAAARASVHILIPEMKDELDAHDTRAAASASANDDTDFSFFDHVGILDPRIMDFCAATCEPSPHAILKTCLLRNFGTGDRHIHIEMKKLEYQKVELTMKVGKHSATVACKNKKTAKQRASQSILQALHPHVRSWGSLLRLYGSKSVKSCKEKKQEEQQITLLQDKARHNEPNYAVLEKLKSEMKKLRERDGAMAPIGTFLLTDCLPTHSNSNLNNVEL